MRNNIKALTGASLLLGVSMVAAQAQMVEPTSVPAAPTFSAQVETVLVGRNDIQEYKALGSYSEPAYVSALVDAGKLPAVGDRLPNEPLVFKTGNMPDGVGVYGGTLRHVIGGRPQGWNWISGQTQGWGGISMMMYECLTRTGPLYQVRGEELSPLPSLAKSWDWSEDGHELTMNLIEGAKWSDGDPFDSDDVMYFWNDHVLDDNISPQGGATKEAFGADTSLEAVGPYTLKWTFQEERPAQPLYSMAFGSMCPGPSHIMKPQHPNYSDNTYDEYVNAFTPDMLNFPVMGSHTVAEYRPDDIIVLRRNPFYWKVDEAGNQLPYLDEVQYKLSTWADRDVQAVAGSGDWSNLEQAESFVEALRRSADADAPSRLDFGPRIIGYGLEFNLSANGWGEPDERGQAVRELNRNLNFRKGVTTAIDRARLGNSLVKGPFTALYPGGIYAGTSYYDADSSVYYPYSVDTAKGYFEKAGLVDTDGDGFVNWPADTLSGGNVEITILAQTSYATDRNLAEGIVALMEESGLRVIPNLVADTVGDDMGSAGQFDWKVRRGDREYITTVQHTNWLAPVGPRSNPWHRAGTDGTLDLLPFEQEAVDAVNAFIATSDAGEKVAAMKTYQRLHTENVYTAGLTNYPGALIINKRLRNVAVPPILAFQWAEDSALRERIFVPADLQQGYELHPNTVAGPYMGNSIE